MPEQDDVFINPPAPPAAARLDVEATPSRLTNADFRRLLMTPRSGTPTAGGLGSGFMTSTSADAAATGGSSTAERAASDSLTSEERAKSDRAEERRRKKSFYAKAKRAEGDIMEELARKYRDRAKERREVDSSTTAATTEEAGSTNTAAAAAAPTTEEPAPAPGAYRAVAPDLKSVRDAAERRRQQIQESKFLGGDMEHTHLVKGLDYALLQKVRSEIQAIEQQHEDELEQLVDGGGSQAAAAAAPAAAATVGRGSAIARDEEAAQFRTKLARNVHRTLFGDLSTTAATVSCNELFRPGRMAYRIDLDDDFVDFDIPTTVVRSKADCPQVEAVTTLTTNDIVINKLTQILSYLRQGRGGRRLRRKERATKTNAPHTDADDIYADAGEYAPAPSGDKPATNSLNDGARHVRADIKRVASYFDDGGTRAQHSDTTRLQTADDTRREHESAEKERQLELAVKAQEKLEREKRDKERYELEKGRESNWLGIGSTATVKKQAKGMGISSTEYAECYPGFDEMHDAMDDSDEEADFTKMDQGNKKGPMGRWDFANPDEYSDYMNRKEAMPKAAFQYGVKMADGRKTQGRKLAKNSEKSERAELDREWQKISDIISKRRSTGSSGSSSKKLKS